MEKVNTGHGDSIQVAPSPYGTLSIIFPPEIRDKIYEEILGGRYGIIDLGPTERIRTQILSTSKSISYDAQEVLFAKGVFTLDADIVRPVNLYSAPLGLKNVKRMRNFEVNMDIIHLLMLVYNNYQSPPLSMARLWGPRAQEAECKIKIESRDEDFDESTAEYSMMSYIIQTCRALTIFKTAVIELLCFKY